MALDDPAHQLAVEARYGRQEKPVPLLWNDTIAQLLAHRSIRSYSDAPLDPATIATLVAAAQSAASSSNLQFWSVVAVTDRTIKSKLAVLAGNQRHIDDAPLLLVWVADLHRTHELGVSHGVQTDALDYLDSFIVAAVDAGLAAQNAVVAAESLGLGTVYIGALRNRSNVVAELLDLPPRAVALFGLVVGWPDPSQSSAVKPRLPQQVVLHAERYSPTDSAEAIARYDALSRNFQADRQIAQTGWIAPVLARTAGPASLHGRETLKSILEDRQLPLN